MVPALDNEPFTPVLAYDVFPQPNTGVSARAFAVVLHFAPFCGQSLRNAAFNPKNATFLPHFVQA